MPADELPKLGGAVVLSLAIVIGILVTGLAELMLAMLEDVSAASAIAEAYPATDVNEVVSIAGPAVALAAGLWLLLRGWRGTDRGYTAEVGSGLVLVGVGFLLLINRFTALNGPLAFMNDFIAAAERALQ